MKSNVSELEERMKCLSLKMFTRAKVMDECSQIDIVTCTNSKVLYNSAPEGCTRQITFKECEL
jgi:hypothetical protein